MSGGAAYILAGWASPSGSGSRRLFLVGVRSREVLVCSAEELWFPFVGWGLSGEKDCRNSTRMANVSKTIVSSCCWALRAASGLQRKDVERFMGQIWGSAESC